MDAGSQKLHLYNFRTWKSRNKRENSRKPGKTRFAEWKIDIELENNIWLSRLAKFVDWANFHIRRTKLVLYDMFWQFGRFIDLARETDVDRWSDSDLMRRLTWHLTRNVLKFA